MADISKTVAIVFEGEDRASAPMRKIEEGLRGVEGESGKAAGGLDRIGKSTDGLEKAALSVESMQRAIQGLAIAAVVSEFVDANVAAEKFQRTMEAATGSSTEAAKEFDYVRGLADKFGVELLSTADAYAKFSSAAKGTALEGEGAKLVFEGFVGTMSRLGMSSADVSGALVQLGQGVSKSKFELDDLKSIAERIPGFFTKFADSLGISTSELYELVSAGKIGSAELLKFSDTLRDGLKGVDFDGFTASSARFKNAITEAFVDLGNTGLFSALTTGVQGATASMTGLIALMQLIGETAGNVAYTIASGDWSGFGNRWAESVGKAADNTRSAVDRMLGIKPAAESAGDAGEKAGTKIADAMQKGATSSKDMEKATGEVDKALKALGIDPKTFVEPIDAVKKAFADLAKNPAVNGDQFLSGFLVTLDKIKGGNDIGELGRQLESAYKAGTIGSDKYTAGLAALQQKQDGTWERMVRTTKDSKEHGDAMSRQAKETEKAAEAAQKMKLELEKLASDERIKMIEARVSINVAQLQEDTKRVQSIFSSIDTTIKSTGDLLGGLFGKLNKDTNSFSDQRMIEDQINAENTRRERALKLQEEMTRATIDEMRARTQAMQKNDALIKVDGSKLAPHLEAFMWEILKAIQTRVNKDGMKLLLGV